MCNCLLEDRREFPKFCPACGCRLPRPSEAGFDRMMRRAKVTRPAAPMYLTTHPWHYDFAFAQLR